jgi:hypothetical protein
MAKAGLKHLYFTLLYSAGQRQFELVPDRAMVNFLAPNSTTEYTITSYNGGQKLDGGGVTIHPEMALSSTMLTTCRSLQMPIFEAKGHRIT